MVAKAGLHEGEDLAPRWAVRESATVDDFGELGSAFRLKLVKLLENDKDYYEIVLARVRNLP